MDKYLIYKEVISALEIVVGIACVISFIGYLYFRNKRKELEKNEENGKTNQKSKSK